VDASLDEAGPCTNGIALRLRIRYGKLFSFGSAAWSGNTHQPAANLDRTISLNAGEVARLDTIQSGFAQISKLYWTNGYLDALVNPDPAIDDQTGRVNYRVQIIEGEQYRMGEFQCNLASGSGPCDSLRGRWKLKANEAFSGGYFDEFERTVFETWAKQHAPQGMNLKLQLHKDTASKLATVFVVSVVK
jgi:outer membrane protein assembly factor BamA